MRRTFLKFLLVSTSTISIVYGAGFVATVTKIRGEVSQLEPGSRVARTVKVGDKLLEDSSLLTGDKSFIRIKFRDNTTMNVGPRSKVSVLETRRDGTSFIHLLKGTIRSKVNKANGKTKHKYYLKTRSAAMAVRGTEFQAVYNPENNVSSLLAYEGEVAMAKVEEDPAAELKRLKKIRRKQLKNQKVETSASGEIDVVETRPTYDLEGRMDQALSNNEAVVVKRGQYSGTVNTIKRASLPVKISPVQLNALYQNAEMNEKLRRSEVKSQNFEVGSRNLIIQGADQEAPPEGIFDKKSGKFAPRSGGVLDLNTGLYVAPESDSLYDSKLKVFVPKEGSGSIDKDTGQYVTPRGLKLDAVKGFVASTKGENKILLAQANSLNDATKTALWAGDDINQVKDVGFSNWSETEKIAKDIIEIEMYGYNETFSSTNETGGNGRKFDTDNAKSLILKWSHNSESKWQPLTSIGFKTTDYTGSRGQVGQPTRDGVLLGLGVRYNLSKRWNFLTELLLEQEHYIDVSGGSLLLKRVTIPKLKLGYEGHLIKSGSFTLDSLVYLTLAVPKESGSHKVGAGLGYGLDLLPRWWINKRWTIYTGLSLQNQKQSVSTTGFKADNSISKFGLKLGFGHLF
ncbi:MAG: hypothetical protein ACJAT2_002817 [Bacteriovoracaceae bacterium]|jgi:hypothetical protein